MSTSTKLKLQSQICHALYSATNALVRAYRPILEELDLTYPQYVVMMALWEEDGVMIKRLVEKTRFDAGTLTPVLKRMVDKSLITMTKSPEDSRQKVVNVTDEGKELMKEATKVPEKLMNKINMPLDDVKRLKVLSEELLRLLTKHEQDQ